MKSNIYIEFNGSKVEAKQIESSFREMWKEKGGKIKDIEEVDLYYKPDESACYYFIAKTEESGRIEF